MTLLLWAYPRRWRERYGDELVVLLEAEPLTWRARADIVRAGFRERIRGSGPPPLRMLWAWSLFVVGGIAFQKTSEHWQGVVAGADRGVPAAAFDTVQVAAAIGSTAVLAGVAASLPAFLRDLRGGGWTALRRPVFFASAVTAVAAGALVEPPVRRRRGAPRCRELVRALAGETTSASGSSAGRPIRACAGRQSHRARSVRSQPLLCTAPT
jgi:hypothetical protein